MLLDIIGEKTTESVKVLGLDDKIGFGKYKDMTLKEVIIKDWQYVKWAIDTTTQPNDSTFKTS